MFRVGGLTINLFRIKTSRPSIRVGYLNLQDNSEINNVIHRLEPKYGCIAGPQYDGYRGLEPGVYFICNDYDTLTNDNIAYSFKTINSSSYVMKYLVLKDIARKAKELGNNGKLFLPRNWFAYSQITCCDSEVIRYSEPYKLFVLRPCLVLRIEHIPVDDEDKLFLLADLRLKRFHTLTLSNIAKILVEKGLDTRKIGELLSKHYFSCIDEENRVWCTVNRIENDIAEVVIEGKVQALPLNRVVLNPHPKHTRDFIEKLLGERISEIEKIQRVLSGQRPKRRIENTKTFIKKLLVENNAFPLRLSDVEYTIELTPQIIISSLGEE